MYSKYATSFAKMQHGHNRHSQRCNMAVGRRPVLKRWEAGGGGAEVYVAVLLSRPKRFGGAPKLLPRLRLTAACRCC
jgi:hypothetical protein